MTNSQRMQAYLELIQSLITCPSAQIPEIFNANRELLDAGLVQTMLGVANDLI
ncbi:MAG: hypothetical protein AB4426_16460 [Xenococcaceae cyanobacterium]